jgi:hypothetical protein
LYCGFDGVDRAVGVSGVLVLPAFRGQDDGRGKLRVYMGPWGSPKPASLRSGRNHFSDNCFYKHLLTDARSDVARELTMQNLEAATILIMICG